MRMGETNAFTRKEARLRCRLDLLEYSRLRADRRTGFSQTADCPQRNDHHFMSTAVAPRKMGVFGMLKQTFSDWSEDKALRLSAAVAYYSIFSIAPLLVIAIGVAGLV